MPGRFEVDQTYYPLNYQVLLASIVDRVVQDSTVTSNTCVPTGGVASSEASLVSNY